MKGFCMSRTEDTVKLTALTEKNDIIEVEKKFSTSEELEKLIRAFFASHAPKNCQSKESSNDKQ